MNDEISDRIYQAGRANLNDGLDRALVNLRSGALSAFGKLQTLHFAGPRTKKTRDVGCA